MTIKFINSIYLAVLLFCPFALCAQQDTTVWGQGKVNSVKNDTVRKAEFLPGQLQKTVDVKEIIGQSPNSLVKRISQGIPAPAIPKVKLLTEGKFLTVANIDLFAGYTYMRDTSGFTTGIYKTVQGVANYSASGSIVVKNIPFNISVDGNNGFSPIEQPPLNSFYKTNFDPALYKELLQKQVLSKIKPEVVLGSIMTRINDIRQGYEKSLLSEIGGIQKEFGDQFSDKLNLPADVSDISKTDVASLRNRLFQDISLEKYNESVARYQEIIKTKGTGETDTSQATKSILRDIKKYEALEKTYGKVIAMKDKFENNKIVKELKSHLPFTPDKYKAYLSNPGNLAEVIKKHGDLSAIQNIFLNLTNLDMGQNPVQSGELNMQNIINTGVNTGIQTKKASGGFIAGTNNNVNNWMQSGLNSIVTNEYSGMTGLTLGTGSRSAMNQSVSVNFFNFMRSPGSADGTELFRPSYLAAAKRQDAVITFHSGFKLAANHEINVDVSRSIGTYRNNMNADSSVSVKNASSSVLSNEGKSNFAALVDYKGEILQTGLQLSVKKVGLGYNNPGNIFLRKGETQFQLGLNKKLLKQKLTVKYKTDYRYQHFDLQKNYTYTTFSNKLQLGYRIKRNSRVGISYQHSDYKSKMFAQQGGGGKSSILQGDGSYKLNIFKKPVHNSITISRQVMQLPVFGADNYNSRSLFFVHSSSMPVRKSLLIFSLVGNQSNNKDFYFNTSFVNGELNYTYNLAEKIRLTSGSGYYYNKGWNTQVGLKQQVTANVLEKMDIDLGMDYKKAIRTIRTELANQIFINASVHYRFN